MQLLKLCFLLACTFVATTAQASHHTPPTIETASANQGIPTSNFNIAPRVSFRPGIVTQDRVAAGFTNLRSSTGGLSYLYTGTLDIFYMKEVATTGSVSFTAPITGLSWSMTQSTGISNIAAGFRNKIRVYPFINGRLDRVDNRTVSPVYHITNPTGQFDQSPVGAIMTDLSWSPTGSYLAAIFDQDIPNARTPNLRIFPFKFRTLDTSVTVSSDSTECRFISWHPDGTYFAVTNNNDDYPWSFKVFSFNGTTMVEEIRELIASPTLTYPRVPDSIAFSPNGRYLAIGATPYIVIYDFDATTPSATLAGYIIATNPTTQTTCWSIAWAPDSKHLAVGGTNDDTDTWQKIPLFGVDDIVLDTFDTLIKEGPIDRVSSTLTQTAPYSYTSTGTRYFGSQGYNPTTDGDIAPIFDIAWNNSGKYLLAGLASWGLSTDPTSTITFTLTGTTLPGLRHQFPLRLYEITPFFLLNEVLPTSQDFFSVANYGNDELYLATQSGFLFYRHLDPDELDSDWFAVTQTPTGSISSSNGYRMVLHRPFNDQLYVLGADGIVHACTSPKTTIKNISASTTLAFQTITGEEYPVFFKIGHSRRTLLAIDNYGRIFKYLDNSSQWNMEKHRPTLVGNLLSTNNSFAFNIH